MVDRRQSQPASNDELVERIRARKCKLGVVGLGTVGLSVACAFAAAGFSAIGIDIDEERIACIQRGVWPSCGDEPELPALLEKVTRDGLLVASTDCARLRDVEIFLIAVDTPTKDDRTPDFDALRLACETVGTHLKGGALVIVESTIAPGTMATLVAPTLERTSKLERHRGFLLGHCPELVMPGKLLSNLRTMSRVCGAESQPA